MAVKLEEAVLLNVGLLLVVGVQVQLEGFFRSGSWWQGAASCVGELLPVGF